MAEANTPQLKRFLGPAALMVYGIGDMLGAGIYVLAGKVAGLVGPACWISFAVSFVVASLTGLSYAELGSRFPRSAGEAVFSLRAFSKPLLSYLTGFLVLLSGIVSMATVSHGFAGYIRALFPGISLPLLLFLFLGGLAFINYRGIKESSLTNIVCTCIEVTGIFIVIAAGLKFFGNTNYTEVISPPGISPHTAILQGSILAFYAFIGFEDIVNVAEETKKPERSVPTAILGALGVTGILYVLTAIAAVSAVSSTDLSNSTAPLLRVVEKGLPWMPKEAFTLIAVFAVTNTALINFIMSSRILYGMGREKLLPPLFSKVHPLRNTPYISIFLVFLIALALAVTGTLVLLAQSTSLLLLIVFLIMNLSLIAVKIKRSFPIPRFQVPLAIPVLGALCCSVLILYSNPDTFGTVSILIALGLILFSIQKIRRVK